MADHGGRPAPPSHRGPFAPDRPATEATAGHGERPARRGDDSGFPVRPARDRAEDGPWRPTRAPETRRTRRARPARHGGDRWPWKTTGSPWRRQRVPRPTDARPRRDGSAERDRPATEGTADHGDRPTRRRGGGGSRRPTGSPRCGPVPAADRRTAEPETDHGGRHAQPHRRGPTSRPVAPLPRRRETILPATGHPRGRRTIGVSSGPRPPPLRGRRPGRRHAPTGSPSRRCRPVAFDHPGSPSARPTPRSVHDVACGERPLTETGRTPSMARNVEPVRRSEHR